jgi:hypothetical protein
VPFCYLFIQSFRYDPPYSLIMISKVVVSSAILVAVANAAAIGRRQDMSSSLPSSSLPASSQVSSAGPQPSSVNEIVLPPNGSNTTLVLPTNGTVLPPNGSDETLVLPSNGSNLNSRDTNSTDTNSTSTSTNSQGETWGQWGSAVGDYYSSLYASPDDVPGLPQFNKRETWGQWGDAAGNYYSSIYASPDDVPGLPQFNKRSPETWGQWGNSIGNYYANMYNSPDDVPGLPQFNKRSPQIWGDAIPTDFANGLVKPYKRAPETWGQWGDAIGNYYSNLYGSPDDVPGLPQFNKRAPETWGQWGDAVGNYYSSIYASPDDVPGLPQFNKRQETPDEVVSQIRQLQVNVTSSMQASGKGDSVLIVVDQLENLVTLAEEPGADLSSILSQAQNIANNA